MFLSARLNAASAVALLVALTGCNQSTQPKAPAVQPPSQASLDWQEAANGFVQSYFAAQPFFAAQSGKHEYDGQLPDVSEHGLKREVGAAARRARPYRVDRPEALAPQRAIRPPISLERRGPRSVLDREDSLSDLESLLVRRQPRSGSVPEPQLRAARRAHEGLHQICARHPENGQGYSGQLERTAAENLRRARHREVRRLRRFLQEGRGVRVRLGERSSHAEGFDRRRRKRRPGNGEFERLPDRPAQDRERQLRAGQGPLRADDQGYRTGRCPDRSDRGGGPRGPSAQHRHVEERVRDLPAQGLARGMRRQDGREEAAGRAPSRPRAGSSRCSGTSFRRTTS